MKKAMVLCLFVLFAFSAMSQERTRRADGREKMQRGRIYEGRKSGEVTNGEAALLNAEQRHIRRAERRTKADGDVTVREKRRLERKQDRASRHIRRAKHNDLDKGN